MKFIHMAQRYRPQTALFGRRWIIEAGLMDSKSGFGAAGDREMCAFKFGLLTVLLWFLRSFWWILIVRTPNVRPLRDTCALKELRSDSINAAKFYLILRSLNLKFSPQNLIAPYIVAADKIQFAPYCRDKILWNFLNASRKISSRCIFCGGAKILTR